MNSRTRSLYVTDEAIWLLGKLVRNQNDRIDRDEPADSIDGMANDIILQWVKTTHPKLMDLYQRRKDLDDEALTLLKEKKQ